MIPFTPETTLVGSVFVYFDNINIETIKTASPTNDTQSDFGSDDSYITPNANDLEQLSVSSSGILPDNTKELDISFDIDNGGIKILPATSNEIKASYVNCLGIYSFRWV